MTTICHDHDTQHRHLSEGRAVHRLVAQPGHASPVVQPGHASPVAQTGHASPVLGALAARDLPCREHPADLWFAELPEDVELAKELCLPCPLREACLAGARVHLAPRNSARPASTPLQAKRSASPPPPPSQVRASKW